MARLASRHCTALKKGTKPIRDSLSQSLLNQLNPEWRMSKNKQAIERVFQFNNFQETVGFVNAVAWIANLENHHPELQIGHNRCEVSYSSHIADGLTVNDFICASKIDALFKGEQFGKPGSETETKQPRTAGTPVEKVEKALQFDAAEVDALLQAQAKPGTTATPKKHDDEDEFELIDPDEVAAAKQETPKETAKPEPAKPQEDTKNLPDAEPSAARSQPAQPAGRQRNEPTKPQSYRLTDKQQKAPEPARRQPSQPANNQPTATTPLQTPANQLQKAVNQPGISASNSNRRSEPLSTSGTLIDPDIAHAADNFKIPGPVKPDIDLMSTVILPPGMQSIDDPVKAKDDEEDATVILSDTTATAEIDDKELNLKSASYATDDEKQDTVISEPAPLEDDLDRTLILAPEQIAEITATVNIVNNPKPEATSKEENTEKTMVLTSDPTHAVRRLKKPAQPPPNVSTNTDNNTETRKDPVTEENVEKTMSLSSEPDKAGQSASPPPPPQGAKNTSNQSSDPGIEDDETLVMHSNTYKSVKHGPEK